MRRNELVSILLTSMIRYLLAPRHRRTHTNSATRSIAKIFEQLNKRCKSFFHLASYCHASDSAIEDDCCLTKVLCWKNPSTDTILKKYSSTVATIFTGLASAALFGHTLTINFILGVTIVFISMHQVWFVISKT